jgi:hypothetical protein
MDPSKMIGEKLQKNCIIFKIIIIIIVEKKKFCAQKNAFCDGVRVIGEESVLETVIIREEGSAFLRIEVAKVLNRCF